MITYLNTEFENPLDNRAIVSERMKWFTDWIRRDHFRKYEWKVKGAFGSMDWRTFVYYRVLEDWNKIR